MRYIGLDIGDGESAATLVIDQNTMTQEVLTLGSEQSMLSVVGMVDGRPVVGSDALTDARVTERSARFKSRFLSDEEPKDLRRFVEGLHTTMRQTAQHALSGDPEDIRLALGHPAGWDENTCRRYAQIATDAGFPNVHTVSESRAAFLYVHYDRELQISTQNLARPCLVIDIGSSTTDFAYIVDGRESNVGVFGQNHLGGGLLDRAILADAVTNCTPEDQKRIAEVFAKYPSWYSECELYARKKKEEYFLQEARGVTSGLRGSVAVFADVEHPVFVEFCLDKERMERLLRSPLEELDGASFVSALKDALYRAKKFTQNPEPEWLILTGGASRMRVFQEACSAAFPKAEVLICPQPEFSIARGLGIAARIDDQMSCFRKELNEFFESDALYRDVTENIHVLKRKLIPQIADIVLKEGVIPALRLAVQDGVDDQKAFLDHVEAYIYAYGQSEENLRPLQQTVQEWAQIALTKTQTRMDDTCAKYQVDSAQLKLSSLPIRLDISGVQLPWLFSRLLDVMGFVNHQGFRAFLAAVQRSILNNRFNRASLQNGIQSDLMQDGKLANLLCQHLANELRNNLSKHVQEAEIMLR